MLRRIMNGRRQAPETIHQATLVRLASGPDPALGHFVDLLDGQVTAGRGSCQKVLVNVAHAGLDHLSQAWIQRPAQIGRALEPRGGHAAGVHAQFVEGLVHGRQHAEHADRAGDGGRIGQHLVGRGGHPVAAGSGHVAHRHDHRFAGFARDLQLAPDQLGAEGTAAGRVDSQHHGLDRVVVARTPNQLGRREAADRALRGFPIDDVALRNHDRHL